MKKLIKKRKVTQLETAIKEDVKWGIYDKLVERIAEEEKEAIMSKHQELLNS